MQQVNRKSPIGAIVGLLIVAAIAFVIFRACAPRGQSGIPETGAQEGSLGRAFTAAQVDQNGCPVETTTQFGSSQPVIVGFTESEIPAGTSMFARLSYEGRPVEDTQEITADRDMTTCVWFEFRPSAGSGFDPGEYTAELFVNGNRADQVRLSVVDDGLAAPGAGGDLAGVQLGRLFTATEVDRNGCPVNFADRFERGEPVYVAYEQSRIPAGTEMFARLYFEGDPVEDTDPILADREMTTCVWFVFAPETGAAGLEPGPYAAEIFVNGRPVDQIEFDVR